MTTVTVTHPPTNIAPNERHPDRQRCPETFEAEVEEHTTENSYDLATIDPSGQHPNMADQLAASGAALTREQWDLLAATPNPSWTATYERVVIEAGTGVTHQVARCPSCGTTVKVG